VAEWRRLARVGGGLDGSSSFDGHLSRKPGLLVPIDYRVIYLRFVLHVFNVITFTSLGMN
jgi:hypothetical protein